MTYHCGKSCGFWSSQVENRPTEDPEDKKAEYVFHFVYYVYTNDKRNRFEKNVDCKGNDSLFKF